MHDINPFDGNEVGSDGKFACHHISDYWGTPDRHPFLMQVDEYLAGLTILKRGSEMLANRASTDVAEYFVLRGYRRQSGLSQLDCRLSRTNRHEVVKMDKYRGRQQAFDG